MGPRKSTQGFAAFTLAICTVVGAPPARRTDRPEPTTSRPAPATRCNPPAPTRCTPRPLIT